MTNVIHTPQRPTETFALALTIFTAVTTIVAAQHEDAVRPAEWDELAPGGRFMDRFQPAPLLGERQNADWGVDAVNPRDLLNGIEESEWSYWGGNILQDEDQIYHLFVCPVTYNRPRFGLDHGPRTGQVYNLHILRLSLFRQSTSYASAHNQRLPVQLCIGGLLAGGNISFHNGRVYSVERNEKHRPGCKRIGIVSNLGVA